MRTISPEKITATVAGLCGRAACDLPADVEKALCGARERESSDRAGHLLEQCCQNAALARREQVPICQDTGVAVFFIELGHEVHIPGEGLVAAVERGVARGYAHSFLRNSMVADPLFDRVNTGNNTPAVIHVENVPGETCTITLAPKGGGSENMSALAMLTPSQGVDGVVDFVVSTVVKAGGNPCPPVVVGVGIGGTFEKTALLAKKALLRPLGRPHPNEHYAELEQRILSRINTEGSGPQGLGGDTTALAVHIEHFPAHIASLPCAVNLNCHAARHARAEL